MNLLQRFTNRIKKTTQNLFNEAFFKYIGTAGSSYDTNGKTYLEEGYNKNSFVYSIIQAQAKKTASIPYFIKKVDNETKANYYKREIKRSNITDPQTKIFLKNLENKAFVPGDDNIDFPLKKPNVNQSWTEFIAMYKTYMKLNGNCYLYSVSPDEGNNAGQPLAIYILPAHLMNIILKENADFLLEESPIDYYKLIEGNSYVRFDAKDITHIKYPNPEFSLTGSHLYGVSPLKAALKNIESANEAVNNNIKTMKNSGSFGIISGKTDPITPEQAVSIKERLTEMDNDPSRLSNIAGVNQSIDFTRLSLSTKDLMPFEFLHYDKKEIAACLNWMLIDSTVSDYGGTIKEIKKENVVADILPDLGLFEDAFKEILKKFKGYENTMLIFDSSTLPEMQADMATLTAWLSTALLDGTINRNEYREALNYPIIEGNADFERFTTKMGIVPLEETFVEPEEPETVIVDESKGFSYKKFDPNQARDKDGQWTDGELTELDGNDLTVNESELVEFGENRPENIKKAKAFLEDKGFEVIVQPGNGARWAAIHNNTTGAIHINKTSGYWKNPVLWSQSNFKSGHLSTDIPTGTLYHEMAHGLFRMQDNWNGNHKEIASKVSRYARTNPKEFVAEVYAGIKTGKKYDSEVINIWKRYAEKRNY